MAGLGTSTAPGSEPFLLTASILQAGFRRADLSRCDSGRITRRGAGGGVAELAGLRSSVDMSKFGTLWFNRLLSLKLDGCTAVQDLRTTGNPIDLLGARRRP